MAALLYCNYCGMSYTDDPLDYKAHQKNHQRKQLAERVFGHIAPYSEREYLKRDNHYADEHKCTTEYKDDYNDELTLYAWWSRSVEACNYDLKHPNLYEYIRLYRSNSPLIRGSYVNMKLYKASLEKPDNTRYMVCTKPGQLVILNDFKSNEDIEEIIEVKEGDRFKITCRDSFYHISIMKEDKPYVALLIEKGSEDEDYNINEVERFITAYKPDYFNERHNADLLFETDLAEFIKI